MTLPKYPFNWKEFHAWKNDIDQLKFDVVIEELLRFIRVELK